MIIGLSVIVVWFCIGKLSLNSVLINIECNLMRLLYICMIKVCVFMWFLMCCCVGMISISLLSYFIVMVRGRGVCWKRCWSF